MLKERKFRIKISSLWFSSMMSGAFMVQFFNGGELVNFFIAMLLTGINFSLYFQLAEELIKTKKVTNEYFTPELEVGIGAEHDFDGEVQSDGSVKCTCKYCKDIRGE